MWGGGRPTCRPSKLIYIHVVCPRNRDRCLMSLSANTYMATHATTCPTVLSTSHMSLFSPKTTFKTQSQPKTTCPCPCPAKACRREPRHVTPRQRQEAGAHHACCPVPGRLEGEGRGKEWQQEWGVGGVCICVAEERWYVQAG